MLRVPAITPDARRQGENPTVATGNGGSGSGNGNANNAATATSHRTVSFTALTPAIASDNDNSLPLAKTTAAAHNDHCANRRRHDPLEIARRYSQYRSAPDQFPSYERMRFVRLPHGWLPPALAAADSTGEGMSTNAATTTRQRLRLQHWPALVYQNLAELVRDLSPGESRRLKAKLILEHRKRPRTVVARLLGWNNKETPPAAAATNSSTANNNFKSSDDDAAAANDNLNFANPFEETELVLIRLCGSSIEDAMAHHRGQLVEFIDGQIEFETACDELLEGEAADAGAIRHALRFRAAVDMALNCIALDMGDEPLPPRRDDADAARVLATPTAAGAAAADRTAVAIVRKGSLKTPLGVAARKSSLKTPSNAAVMDKSKKTNENKGGATKKKRVLIGGSVFDEGGNDGNDGKGKKKDKREGRRPLAEVKASGGEKENCHHNTANRGTNGKPSSKRMDSAKERSDKIRRESKKTKKAKEPPIARKRSVAKQIRRAVPAASIARPVAKLLVKTNKPAARDRPRPRAASRDAASPAASTGSDSSAESVASWPQVWAHMKKCGWSWKGGTGLMTDYYYVKPSRRVKGGVRGQDYFVSETETQEHAREAYGWGVVEGDSNEGLFARIEEYAKHCGEVVPPLSANEAIGECEPWREAWEKMLRSGWTWRPGSGLMMDYYYIKPGCRTKGGKEGQDFFVNVEDVQNFARRNYGWRGDEEEGAVDATRKEGEKSKKRRAAAAIAASGKHRRAEVADASQRSVPEKPRDERKRRATKSEPKRMIDLTENDADNASFASALSHFSEESGFRSKKLFLEECADKFVPPLRCDVDPNEPWRDVWEKMRKSGGWSWRVGSGLTDYYYVKPGRAVKGGVEGQDYFVKAEDVQRFAMRNYGWRGCKGTSGVSSRRRCLFESETPVQNKRQRVEKATASKPVSCADTDTNAHKDSSSPAHDCYDKKTLWQALQKDGWRAVGAGKYNILHDWYYVRPNCDPGDGSSKLGVDYFLSEEDAIESVNMRGKTALDAHKSNKAKQQGDTPLPPPARYEKKALWQSLQKDGWRAISAGRYNMLHDWYYVRPNCDPGHEGSQLGVDYFLSEEDAINYVKSSSKNTSESKISCNAAAHRRKNEEKCPFKIKIPSISEVKEAAVVDDGLQTPADCRTKPQDPAIPLLPSADKSCRSTSTNLYEWSTLWQMLQRAGWTCVKAGKYSALADWYYVRPRRDPGDASSELGRHYFSCQDDVVNFVRRLDETNMGTGKKTKKSMGIMLCAFEEEA